MSLVSRISKFFGGLFKRKPSVYDGFPKPSLCGNITLDNSMVFRFSPEGVAVPVAFGANRDYGARAVVRDYLSETYTIPNAINFTEPLEWLVVDFSQNHRGSFCIDQEWLELKERTYESRVKKLLKQGYRFPRPVEVVDFVRGDGQASEAFRNFERSKGVSFHILTSLTVHEDKVYINDKGRRNEFYAQFPGIYRRGSVDGALRWYSDCDGQPARDFYELLYCDNLADPALLRVGIFRNWGANPAPIRLVSGAAIVSHGDFSMPTEDYESCVVLVRSKPQKYDGKLKIEHF